MSTARRRSVAPICRSAAFGRLAADRTPSAIERVDVVELGGQPGKVLGEALRR